MKILITGATSQIGHFLLPRLIAANHSCCCISRKLQLQPSSCRWVQADLKAEDVSLWQTNHADVWVHLGFLALAIPHLEAAAKSGVRRFIAFSSTSVFTKVDSSSSHEHQMIQRLLDAERAVTERCPSLNMAWTIFRPTLIYGARMDQNISFIAQTVERFGVFPVIGDGDGLRQPVHADDLAIAVVSVLNHPTAFNKAYNLSGGETLSYRAMVQRVFELAGRKSRIVRVPPRVYVLAVLSLRRLIPRYAFLQTTMVERMRMDMVFDHREAQHDFGYEPRGLVSLGVPV